MSNFSKEEKVWLQTYCAYVNGAASNMASRDIESNAGYYAKMALDRFKRAFGYVDGKYEEE